MKAVAVALVLIAGAAVVLWYGNTLNSWVLGGLIGGLAALLLSIPISLSLFSYLSRRHDERTRAEEVLLEEENLRLHRREQRYIESSISKSYEDEREEYELERARRQQLAARKRMLDGASAKALPAPRTKELAEHRETDRTLPTRGHYPGLPGTTSNLSRGKHQSEALRTARLEAQQGDEIESQRPQRRYGAGRGRRLEEGTLEENAKGVKRTKYLAEQAAARREAERFVEENVVERPTRQRREREPETGYSTSYSVDTEPIQPPEHRTRQTTRQPHIESEYLKEEDDPGKTLRTKPLIRRAPYLYDDDPLRQKLSQHLDSPSVRRSSRTERNEEPSEEEL
jgi:hypothetical protein